MDPEKELQEVVSRLNALAAKAEDEGWTEEERTEVDQLEGKVVELKKQIADDKARKQADRERLDRIKKLKTEGSGRRSAPNGGLGGEREDEGHEVGNPRPAWEKDPMKGFRNHSDFLGQVMESHRTNDFTSDNLKHMAAGSDEHGAYSDPRGGFLIPQGMLSTVRMIGAEMDPTTNLVSPIPIAGPSVKVPYRVDKDHSDTVTGGIDVQWTAETQAPDATNTKFGEMTLEKHELVGLTYATRKLLKYSLPAFSAIISQSMGDAFSSKIIDAKMKGNGTGKPLGILNSEATISIAKEDNQAADSILGINLVKMRARCWMYQRAIWLLNADCYTEVSAAHRAMTNSDIPLFIPGNGSDVPDSILGRPAYFIEHCQTVGDQGDVVLGVWGEYFVNSDDAMQQESSIHVRFEHSEEAFKFYKEVAGAPAWETFLTPKNSGETQSPFVVLDARAG